MTHPIAIVVTTAYLDAHSQPQAARYAFRYTIDITNQGDEPVTLVSRHWRITDANEQVQEVQGAGVVGEQPEIDPGQTFTYTSGAILQTQTGIMQGSYQMRRADGSEFDAPIPAFALVPPTALH
ncbi:MAG TPA: Co2+/Mg2+ efflux protein ApaG [Cellvibrionaceae bacterium]